ncbi:MAG: hypothetical protein ACM31C_27255 [Acidobacteriota bacterium]
MGVPAHPVVTTSVAALRRLAELHPPADADKIAAELELAWAREPLVAGLAGDPAARTELVNFLCGRKVLDPKDRALGGAAVRVARGDKTQFRAVREDGTIEEHALPPEVDGEEAVSRHSRIEGAKGLLAERDLALDRVSRHLPRALRGRPRWWQFWLWPVRWLLGRFHRRAMMEQQLAFVAAREAHRALEAAEEDLATAEERVRVVRARYFESLRAVSRGSGVRELALALGAGPLPDGVELLELAAASRALDALDAVVFVEGGVIYLTDAELQNPAKIGPVADAIAAIPKLLVLARAKKLATRARDAISAVVSGADEILERAETGFAARLQKLADMKITDTTSFMRAALDRVKPQTMTSVHAVIEHASAHLGAEMARLAEAWIGAIASTNNKDELKAIVGKLEASSTQVTQRIADEVRVLVIGGAAGVAHDLYPELTAGLAERGLLEERPREAPELPPIDVLSAFAKSSASKLGGTLKWLTGVFRSFDSQRTDIREKAHARIEHLREVAYAELLETEPRIHAALYDVMAKQLAAATTRQRTWHLNAEAAENEAITAERAALAPLRLMRDAAKTDLESLEKELAALAVLP